MGKNEKKEPTPIKSKTLLDAKMESKPVKEVAPSVFSKITNLFATEEPKVEEKKLKYFKSIGEGVAIQENIIQKIDRFHCGIIARYPLIEPLFRFSIRIDKLSDTQPTGFVVGVSRVRNLKIPHTLGGNWLFWLICFDGWQWCGKGEHWKPIKGLTPD